MRLATPPTMVAIGYALSSEDHGPAELVRYAAAAERAGPSHRADQEGFLRFLTDEVLPLMA